MAGTAYRSGETPCVPSPCQHRCRLPGRLRSGASACTCHRPRRTTRLHTRRSHRTGRGSLACQARVRLRVPPPPPTTVRRPRSTRRHKPRQGWVQNRPSRRVRRHTCRRRLGGRSQADQARAAERVRVRAPRPQTDSPARSTSCSGRTPLVTMGGRQRLRIRWRAVRRCRRCRCQPCRSCRSVRSSRDGTWRRRTRVGCTPCATASPKSSPSRTARQRSTCRAAVQKRGAASAPAQAAVARAREVAAGSGAAVPERRPAQTAAAGPSAAAPHR